MDMVLAKQNAHTMNKVERAALFLPPDQEEVNRLWPLFRELNLGPAFLESSKRLQIILYMFQCPSLAVSSLIFLIGSEIA